MKRIAPLLLALLVLPPVWAAKADRQRPLVIQGGDGSALNAPSAAAGCSTSTVVEPWAMVIVAVGMPISPVPLIGAWDKRLVEFMGDNAKWAIREHLADARLFGSHVELLGGTLTSMQSVIKAQDAASGEPSAAARKKAEAQRKQREKENAEYEKQLLADLKL